MQYACVDARIPGTLAQATVTTTIFRSKSCQPTALVLPIAKNKKFGTFSLYGQHSGKLSDLWEQRTAFENDVLAMWNDNHAANFGSDIRGFAAVQVGRLASVADVASNE